jgi:hypothetical protein
MREQSKNDGRVPYGFMSDLITHYSDEGQDWVTRQRIHHALKEALNIPTELSIPTEISPVATIAVVIGGSSSFFIGMSLCCTAVYDVDGNGRGCRAGFRINGTANLDCTVVAKQRRATKGFNDCCQGREREGCAGCHG